MRSISVRPLPRVLFALWAVLVSLAVIGGAQSAKPPARNLSSRPASAIAPRSNVDMLDAIKRSGKLRVGVYESVPWTMRNKDGELIGFEVDVAKKLAQDLGVAVEFHPAEFHYLIPDLLDNRFDVIIADFSIEVSRALKVNFSNPYNVTDVALVANAKLAKGLTTMDAYNQPGVRIGVTEGATSERLGTVNFPKASIQPYTQERQLLDDLLHEKLTAAIVDKPRLDILAKLYPEALHFPAVSPLGTFPAAFAVRRGDMGFVNFLNSWIYARSADKWLDSRRRFWFGTTEWAEDL